MANKMVNNLVIEGARIIFRNFAGKEEKYNPAGKRNFCVLLDFDLAQKLIDDGWNIKWLKPRDDQEEAQAYLQVSVSYDNIPPKIWLVTKKNKSLMEEEAIVALDYAEISNVDLIISPYSWEVNGKSGIKAYLKTMYVTIAEDEFESKYFGDNEDSSLPFD